MKIWLKSLAPFAAFAAALAHPVAAQTAEDDYVAPADELAEAMQIMEAMFPAETRDEMMMEMIDSLLSQMGPGMMQGPIFEEPGIRAIMDEFIAELPETMRPMMVDYMPNMIDAMAIAYTREFTLEELKEISAFAQTPAGSRYFANVQSLLSDPTVAEVNQAYFQQVGVIQREQAVAVQQRVEAYLKANPEVLERLKAKGVGQGN